MKKYMATALLACASAVGVALITLDVQGNLIGQWTNLDGTGLGKTTCTKKVLKYLSFQRSREDIIRIDINVQPLKEFF